MLYHFQRWHRSNCLTYSCCSTFQSPLLSSISAAILILVYSSKLMLQIFLNKKSDFLFLNFWSCHRLFLCFGFLPKKIVLPSPGISPCGWTIWVVRFIQVTWHRPCHFSRVGIASGRFYGMFISWLNKVNGRVWAPTPGGRTPMIEVQKRSSRWWIRWSKKKKKKAKIWTMDLSMPIA